MKAEFWIILGLFLLLIVECIVLFVPLDAITSQ